MKTLLKDIKTVRKDLFCIFLISFFTILSIDFIFDRIPELFTGGHKMGNIIEKLCLSYMSGFIFYFLTVHIKTERNKRSYNETIGRLTFNIINGAKYMTSDIMSYNLPNRKDYDEKLIYNACMSINALENDAPLQRLDGTQYNWLEYLYYYSNKTKSDIKELNDRMIYLEAEHSKLISRIENGLLLKQINGFNHNPQNFPLKNLSIFSTSITLFMNLINDLEVYANYHLKDYKYTKAESVGYDFDKYNW